LNTLCFLILFLPFLCSIWFFLYRSFSFIPQYFF
jgi:hypothetical protein